MLLFISARSLHYEISSSTMKFSTVEERRAKHFIAAMSCPPFGGLIVTTMR